jgi:hypothetical protein
MVVEINLYTILAANLKWRNYLLGPAASVSVTQGRYKLAEGLGGMQLLLLIYAWNVRATKQSHNMPFLFDLMYKVHCFIQSLKEHKNRIRSAVKTVDQGYASTKVR